MSITCIEMFPIIIHSQPKSNKTHWKQKKIAFCLFNCLFFFFQFLLLQCFCICWCFSAFDLSEPPHKLQVKHSNSSSYILVFSWWNSFTALCRSVLHYISYFLQSLCFRRHKLFCYAQQIMSSCFWKSVYSCNAVHKNGGGDINPSYKHIKISIVSHKGVLGAH